MANKTRFAELAYENRGDHWRIITTEDGASVGPIYRSKAELLADLERYATSYGCDGATAQKVGLLHQIQFVMAYAQDVRAHPECYEPSIVASPETYAIEIIEGLNDAEVLMMLRDLQQERRKVASQVK